MAAFEKFSFSTLDEVKEKAREVEADIPFAEDWHALARPVRIGGQTAPNSMAVLPMEGYDCDENGVPGELAIRRYCRFAAGGAGLIWWEACAVVPEGKGNPREMILRDDNVRAYKGLIEQANKAAAGACGEQHRPLHILQLTHSGRYSRPQGHIFQPITAKEDPILDVRFGGTVATDDYLATLPQQFAQAALLAQQAGFDGIEIKACHDYLYGELLSARLREGRYGGSFENRIRLLIDTVHAVRAAAGEDFIIACRLNMYNAHPYEYSFGTDKNDIWTADLEEPLQLVRLLCKEGVGLLTASAGNPHHLYPHLTRPFDIGSEGIPLPEEHPLQSAARLMAFAREMQQAAGNVPVVAAGFSWLRRFAPYAAAGVIENGWVQMAGFARGVLACPDLPARILQGEELNPADLCISCSRCIQIMRDHGSTGCVARDAATYAPLYKEAKENARVWKASL